VKIAVPAFAALAFPPRCYYYDVLRGLDHLRDAGVPASDPRICRAERPCRCITARRQLLNSSSAASPSARPDDPRIPLRAFVRGERAALGSPRVLENLRENGETGGGAGSSGG
jgi:hypothetical protein